MQPWENDGPYVPHKKGTTRKHLKRKARQFVFGIGMASIVYFYVFQKIIKDATTTNQNKET